MKTTTASQGEFEPRGYHVIRDYVESIPIAVMLAFIFRMFLLEAFVIPTGSMAPTLHGRHMDITCIECGYRYQTGASVENADNANVKEVIATDCPLCRYPLTLDKESKPNERSFNGDRILVSKFSYSISDPKRWQVIVFKFPGNAKQNYIKRLVGLPGERIKITGGDIYAVPPDAVDREAFQIVRKSPRKLLAMLQLVHDSKYVPETLQRVGWPASWQPWSPDGELAEGTWETGPNQQGYQVQESNDQVSYLRYRHLPPDRSDWSNVRSAAARNDQGMLITDYYGYNRGRIAQKSSDERWFIEEQAAPDAGLNWVGDLAAEFEVEVMSKTGQVLLDLLEGGTHFKCSIDVQTGQATLSRVGPTGNQEVFTDSQGAQVKHPKGATKMIGAGSYKLRFSNVDNELLLWVNNRLVSFQGPTTYQADPVLSPHWRPDDPGDLAPVGIGSRSVSLQVNRLRILRDVYYIATDGKLSSSLDYNNQDYEDTWTILSQPQRWAESSYFKNGKELLIPETGSLGPDDFLPLGDNSPASFDGRMWAADPKLSYQKHTVPRRLLIGQAMFVYWPHSWRWGKLPIVPNFLQMRMIQ